MGRRGLVFGGVAALGLAGAPRSVNAERVAPFISAEAGFTGEAALAMALASLGRAVGPATLYELSGVDPATGGGADADGLVRAAESLGAEATLWVAAVDGDATSGLWAALQELMRSADALLLELADGDFVRVAGSRGARLRIDHPRSGPERTIRRRELPRRWIQPAGDGGERVRAIVLRAPRGVQTPPERGARIDGMAVARRVRDLGDELGERGWSVAVAGPFIVTGDLPLARLEHFSEGVIGMALSHLRRDYFARDPRDPVVTYLFGDDASYRRHTLEIFGESPETPYGYYDRGRHAMVMNIATGGGTLVHEMVHPLLRVNFPGASPWLDEGLASLFEQCRERDGQLVGMTNWRLPGLQHALRGGHAPGFEELLAGDAAAFYGENRGNNYAVARYLLYYFQERGVLRDLWRRLVAGGRRDDGGLAIVGEFAERLGHRDLGAFRRTWESYVLALRYP